MTSQNPDDHKRRPRAGDQILRALVQRLTERGIIRPDEADDMFALLAAVSAFAVKRAPGSGSDNRRRRPPVVRGKENRSLL